MKYSSNYFLYSKLINEKHYLDREGKFKELIKTREKEKKICEHKRLSLIKENDLALIINIIFMINTLYTSKVLVTLLRIDIFTIILRGNSHAIDISFVVLFT